MTSKFDNYVEPQHKYQLHNTTPVTVEKGVGRWENIFQTNFCDLNFENQNGDWRCR